MRSRSILALVAAFAIVMSVSTRSAEAAIFNDLAALEQSDDFALDPMFDSTGWLVGRNDEGGFMVGSGVLIDPYWVLTAGHVAIDSRDGIGTSLYDSMEFSVTPSIYGGPMDLISASSVFVFDGYNEFMTPGTGDDIALVQLSTAIYDVDPAVRYYGADPVDPHFYAAGYGRPGVWPNAEEFDGIKRAGENIADYHAAAVDATRYWESDLDIFPRDNPLPLEWNLSPLDSGGGGIRTSMAKCSSLVSPTSFVDRVVLPVGFAFLSTTTGSMTLWRQTLSQNPHH